MELFWHPKIQCGLIFPWKKSWQNIQLKNQHQYVLRQWHMYRYSISLDCKHTCICEDQNICWRQTDTHTNTKPGGKGRPVFDFPGTGWRPQAGRPSWIVWCPEGWSSNSVEYHPNSWERWRQRRQNKKDSLLFSYNRPFVKQPLNETPDKHNHNQQIINWQCSYHLFENICNHPAVSYQNSHCENCFHHWWWPGK